MGVGKILYIGLHGQPSLCSGFAYNAVDDKFVKGLGPKARSVVDFISPVAWFRSGPPGEEIFYSDHTVVAHCVSANLLIRRKGGF